MDNTLYIALARQMQLFRTMDAVANNVANVNTTGYKKESVAFSEYVIDAGRRQNVAFSNDIATVRSLEQGALEITNNPLDAAIQGNGYFVVDAPEGERYTRAGNFTRNVDGELVTPQGFPVQGEGGNPILLLPGDFDIRIGQDGTIVARNGQEEVLRGQLRIVKFADQRDLDKVGDTQFTAAGGAAPEPAIVFEDFKLAQGALENSNVNSVKEMTEMIRVSRRVGSTARMMQSLHDMTSDAVSRLARQQ